jgi:ribosomal-protein-alanine N-acetyltransferase
VNLRAATGGDAPALAELHAAAFDAPWSAPDIAALLEGRGAFGLVAEAGPGDVAGFILCRTIAGEAEILTLAVHPIHRRRRVADGLTSAAIRLAAESAKAMFLEVAADNAAAIALYEQAGFESVGRRSGYYVRRSGAGADAIVMRRTLNSRG